MDDDAELVRLLAFIFQQAGFETIAAFDPARALERLNNADIVVLDADLGRHSGFDLLAEVRRRTGVPVIMLMAREGEEDVGKGLELGADDYVTKPFSHEDLVARVRTHLQLRDP